MTDNQSRYSPSSLGWAATVIAIGVLVGVNALLARRLSRLRAELAAADERISTAEETIARRKLDLKRMRRLRIEVRRVSRHDGELDAMLESCTSRDDFIVREGPRFVWSKLSSSTEEVVKIGLYTPAGRHRFNYAVRLPAKREGQNQFTYGDARKIKNAVGFELPDAPQVYEIEVAHDGHGTVQLTLLGAANEVIHESTLPMIDAPCRLGFGTRAQSPAYPSELKNDFRARGYFQERRSAPVTELALGFVGEVRDYLPRRVSHLRLWIESDAPACMSAVEVASHYREVTLLRSASPHRLWDDTQHQDREFDRLFRPYDGSGRLFFRAGVFAE